MKASVYIAVSIDGKIADPQGDVNFLGEYHSVADGDMGFADFLASIDVIIMGRNSFEKVLGFGQDMWAYGQRTVLVWSRQGPHIPLRLRDTVMWSNLSPHEIFQELESTGRQHVYVDGGFTVRAFLKAGLIDELTLTHVPIVMGQGIPLFGNDVYCKLEHLNTQIYSSGLVQSNYRVLK